MPRESLENTHEDDGNTPLDEDELEGLIPSHLVTRADLNQWEAKNIAVGVTWYSSRSIDVLDVAMLKELHRRLFDQTWIWAGSYRQSDKNLSPYHWSEVPRLMRDLVDNTRARIEAISEEEELDKLAARFHHELVHIHPWPNGNGRHSRAATDLLLRQLRRPAFSWGAASAKSGDPTIRSRYIDAIKQADKGNLEPLYEFVRS